MSVSNRDYVVRHDDFPSCMCSSHLTHTSHLYVLSSEQPISSMPSSTFGYRRYVLQSFGYFNGVTYAIAWSHVPLWLQMSVQ